MARTKQTTRRYRADGSFYHSDSETVNSDGSIRVPAREISENPPNLSSDLPQTPTYYSSPSSSGTPSDTILREANSQYKPEPSEQASEESLGEDPTGPSRQSPSSGESSDDDSASSSSENSSVTSEEAKAKISTTRESLSVERGEGWVKPNKAMEKISVTIKPAVVSMAKYRSNVLNRASDELKPVGTPKSGSTRPSPSKQSQSKIQKTGTGDVSASGKNRKHIAHKPKKGDGSTLEADMEVSKPDANQASKGGFKQPSTAVSSAGEKRRHGKEEEVQPNAPVQRPTVVQMAKEMLRALDLEDKASVRGVGTLNLDAILGNLCYAAHSGAKEASPGKVQREIKAIELKQEELIWSLTAANDKATSRTNDLKVKLKDAQSELKALEDADKENTKLRADVKSLGVEIVNLRNQQADEITKEQTRLSEENEQENAARLKIAWGLLYPDVDFEVYKLRYDYATAVYDAQVLGEAAPPRFKDWATELGYEVSDNEEPVEDEQNEGIQPQVADDQSEALPAGQNQPE
ncbi:nuclear autoantigenic sperm protein-like [Chenopodium quinoa]|uniref:nuclear autoantigenic sperm protein-like n=1 Tax=Chenopodium quinoa TaxID=63459 RepID=UPI000B78C5EC|nr:nuclear autoantigenic sperm protein-like [Chenopodium quinoa]